MDADILWGLLRVVVVLAIMIPAVFYATRWYAKRQSTAESIAIKGVVSLGANRALYVVEWEDKRLLLGVTNQAVTVLDEQPVEQESGAEEV